MDSRKKNRQNLHQAETNMVGHSYEVGLIIVAVIALIALSYGITWPWPRSHEGYNGAVYSQYASNYIRYGYLQAKFGQVYGTVPLPPEKFGFYVDHPPLLPIIVSLFFRIFGEHEWSARLVPILFSVASVILIFLIGRKLWNRRVGLIASIAFVANPMFLYYGHMVDHEVLVTFFVLLSVLFYLKWLDGDNRYLWGLCISIFVGCLTGWPSYYLIPIVGLHYLLFVKKKSLLAIAPGLAALIAITLFYLQLKWFGPDSFKVLKSQFLMRSNLDAGQDLSKQITFRMMLDRLVPWTTYFFTMPLFIAAFTGPLVSLYKSYKKRDYFVASILIGLFIFALIHVVLFRHGAMIHSYWTYYFLIPLSLSMGICVDFIGSYIPKKVAFVPALIVFLIMIPLALSGAKGLYEGANYTPAYLGQAISSVTTPGDIVLTSIPSQEFSNWPQIGYYARCNVSGSITDIEGFKNALKQEPGAAVMLALPNMTDPALQKYLSDNYPSTKEFGGNLLFYHLQKSNQINRAY